MLFLLVVLLLCRQILDKELVVSLESLMTPLEEGEPVSPSEQNNEVDGIPTASDMPEVLHYSFSLLPSPPPHTHTL